MRHERTAAGFICQWKGAAYTISSNGSSCHNVDNDARTTIATLVKDLMSNTMACKHYAERLLRSNVAKFVAVQRVIGLYVRPFFTCISNVSTGAEIVSNTSLPIPRSILVYILLNDSLDVMVCYQLAKYLP